jgi:hypothetical protein
LVTVIGSNSLNYSLDEFKNFKVNI